MSHPIKILHVFGALDAGGAESRTMDIYRAIDRTRIQFDFVTHHAKEAFFNREIEALGGKIHILPRFNGKNILRYHRAWKDLLSAYPEYRIIHGHLTQTAFVYLRLAKKMGIPVRIAHARNAKKNHWIKGILTKFARFYANNYWAVSKEAAIHEFGRYLTKRKVQVIPNGIHMNKFVFNADKRAQLKKSLNLQTSTKVIGHIGKFFPQKNHTFLLDVFEQLASKDKTIHLVLLGEEGPTLASILGRIKECEYTSRIHYMGVTQTVEAYYSMFDLLLLPSFFEGLPGVVLEAQASGLPVLMSSPITDEAKLTELVTKLPLNDKTQWVSIILKQLNQSVDRSAYQDKLLKSAYHIEGVKAWYEQTYLSLGRDDDET